MSRRKKWLMIAMVVSLFFWSMGAILFFTEEPKGFFFDIWSEDAFEFIKGMYAFFFGLIGFVPISLYMDSKQLWDKEKKAEEELRINEESQELRMKQRACNLYIKSNRD